VIEVKASEELTPASEAPVARWLGHIQADEQSPTHAPGAPLVWLDTKDPLGTAVHIAERQVLLGWLDGPEIQLSAAAEAMRPGVHDRLIDAPAGTLLLARARAASDPAAHARGLQALGNATSLALEGAAADRDSEQRAVATRTADLRAELGAPIPRSQRLGPTATRPTTCPPVSRWSRSVQSGSSTAVPIGRGADCTLASRRDVHLRSRDGRAPGERGAQGRGGRVRGRVRPPDVLPGDSSATDALRHLSTNRPAHPAAAT
jgi:hypothetical protein